MGKLSFILQPSKKNWWNSLTKLFTMPHTRAFNKFEVIFPFYSQSFAALSIGMLTHDQSPCTTMSAIQLCQATSIIQRVSSEKAYPGQHHLVIGISNLNMHAQSIHSGHKIVYVLIKDLHFVIACKSNRKTQLIHVSLYARIKPYWYTFWDAICSSQIFLKWCHLLKQKMHIIFFKIIYINVIK